MSDIEKNLADVISIAQLLLRSEQDKSKITSSMIEEKVKTACIAVSPQNPEAIDFIGDVTAITWSSNFQMTWSTR